MNFYVFAIFSETTGDGDLKLHTPVEYDRGYPTVPTIDLENIWDPREKNQYFLNNSLKPNRTSYLESTEISRTCPGFLLDDTLGGQGLKFRPLYNSVLEWRRLSKPSRLELESILSLANYLESTEISRTCPGFLLDDTLGNNVPVPASRRGGCTILSKFSIISNVNFWGPHFLAPCAQ